MTTVLARLTGLACASALALAGTAALASPAHAATTTPLHCTTVGTTSDPTISNLLALLGIVAPPGIPAGLSCSAPTKDAPLNFCGQQNILNGLVVLGRVPVNGICP